MVLNERLGDRRSEVRLEIIGELWGMLATDHALPLLNIGRGGALVESDRPLSVGSTHRVRLASAVQAVEMSVAVRHVTRSADTAPRYLVGLELMDLSAEARRWLEILLADTNRASGGGGA